MKISHAIRPPQLPGGDWDQSTSVATEDRLRVRHDDKLDALVIFRLIVVKSMETTLGLALGSSPGSTPGTPDTFQQRYCRLHNCPADSFERHIFRRAVQWPWGWLAPVCVGAFPHWFRRDFRELTVAGRAVTLQEIKEVASEFRKGHDPREARTFVRDTLGFRISGRKLMAEAQRVWKAASE